MSVAQQQREDLVGEPLLQALVGDGFTAYFCGPEGAPTVVIAYYEWGEYLDMVTVPREGLAAAARLAKPDGVRAPDDPLALDPPPTATWACVGPADMAIWALLDLPHPDCPDAPAGEVLTPEALRVPREQQRPMHIQTPGEERKDARAARLGQPNPPVVSERFFNDALDEVDSGSAVGFASNFTQDGEFTWGNFPTLVGRPSITGFTQGFFSLISKVRHQLDHYWLVDTRRAMTTGSVTFTRLDGTEVTVPFATISSFTPDGTKMTNYQVYLDPSPLLQPR